MSLKRKNMQNSRQSLNNEYNEEPVHYCSDCLSLNIKINTSLNLDYCSDCGSTYIESTNIFDWEEQYKNKYGISLLNKSYK